MHEFYNQLNKFVFLKLLTFLYLSKADLEYEICFPYTIETDESVFSDS